MNFTWPEMSTILSTSVKTLRRRAKAWNISKYSHLTDAEIDTCVRRILQDFPGSGEVMLSGYMKARGVVDTDFAIVFIGSVEVKLLLQQFKEECTMLEAGPNYLWHADGNHKLIRYRLVIHAAIDGFSRLITYIKCADNNCAYTVLGYFIEATAEYGVPARIRTDKGGTYGDI